MKAGSGNTMTDDRPRADLPAARELVNASETALAAAGVDNPRFDAELLLAHVLGCTRPRLVTSLDAPVAAEQARRYHRIVNRRERREPVAYITGRKGFRGIELRVDESVLIPRPETELLVDVVKADRPGDVLDIGTGSGAVALALADELPDARVVAGDVSAEALALAAANAERLGLADRVTFVHGDLLGELNGGFDAIAANLPYVPSGEIDGLQPEIAFEPRAALDGGLDGLDLVRELARQVRASGALKPGGLLALEIGDVQGPATAKLLADAGFVAIDIHQDLNGRDRVVSARAPR